MANARFENWRAGIIARVIEISEEEQPWTKNSIYKVPAYLRKLNPEAFTPKVVSIGPYHHADQNLQLMEVHKERAVVHFIKRAGQPLENLIEEVRMFVKTLREAYSCLDEKWMRDDDAFVKMMILDGCFMLEILTCEGEESDYSNMDPFFTINSNQRLVILLKDILLLENQLPATLLKILAKFRWPQYEEAVVTEHINMWAIQFGGNEELDYRALARSYRGPHLLDLCIESHFLPKSSSPVTIIPEETNTKSFTNSFTSLFTNLFTNSFTKLSSANANSSSTTTIVSYSAMEQHEAGVCFKKSETKYFDDVHFNLQNGTFHLPQLKVDGRTEHKFLNMIAFEQLHPGNDKKFVSYLYLMDEIINTADDVCMLRKSGIIRNFLGSDEEVALLFNRATKNMVLDPDRKSTTQVRKDVSIFCGKRRNLWRANMNHTYFRSPWSIISLVGAALIILLTIAQTITSIIQLYQK